MWKEGKDMAYFIIRSRHLRRGIPDVPVDVWTQVLSSTRQSANNLLYRLIQITNLMHNSFILQQYVCYTTILNMFRAARCSSSGGQIISPQPLVSSLSVNSRTVCRWRADWVRSPPAYCTAVCIVTIPEAVVIQFVLLSCLSIFRAKMFHTSTVGQYI